MKYHSPLHDSSPTPTFALADMGPTASAVKAGGPPLSWSVKNRVLVESRRKNINIFNRHPHSDARDTSTGYAFTYGVDGPSLGEPTTATASSTAVPVLRKLRLKCPLPMRSVVQATYTRGSASLWELYVLTCANTGPTLRLPRCRVRRANSLKFEERSEHRLFRTIMFRPTMEASRSFEGNSIPTLTTITPLRHALHSPFFLFSSITDPNSNAAEHFSTARSW